MIENRRRAAMTMVLAFLLATALTGTAGAQDSGRAVSHKVILSVAPVAILGLDNSSPLALTVGPRTGSGTAFAGSEGFRTLYYTTVNAEGSSRAITVQWGAQDSAPSGTSLKIAATRVPNQCGQPAPEVTVSRTAQRLITEIPSGRTGTGALGAVLRYRLEEDNDFQLTDGAAKEVVITFTILDE